MTDRRQFVGDHDCGSIDGGFVECFLDLSFSVRIECACGLVEKEDGGIRDYSSCDRNSLLLAAAEETGSFADVRVVGLETYC